jgi:CheY-like chemotaxis protein
VTTGTAKGTVLLVDDDAPVRDSLRKVLEYEGYTVSEASDGPRALEALKRETPDVVLLDIKMPGMDGMEVLKRIVEADPALPWRPRGPVHSTFLKSRPTATASSSP